MLVFVYGTLKSTYSNNRRLHAATLVKEAIVDGFKAYNVGFPVAMVNEDTSVSGEIWDIGNPEEDAVARSTLQSLDALESYFPENEDGSMYHRRLVSTRCGHNVHMYVGNPKDWDDYFKSDRAVMCPVKDKVYTWSR